MATKNQVAANRLNALKSRGPRTEEGKAVSRHNSLRHGLLAADVVLRSENAEEFSQFRQEILACLKPVGQLETQLADGIAMLAWRLQWCVKVEAALFDNLATDEKASSKALASAFADGTGTFGNLARYEGHLSREYFRTMHELERRQALRAGQPSPPPATADIDINLTVGELQAIAIEDGLAYAQKSQEKEVLRSLAVARVSSRKQELVRRSAEHH